MLAESLIRKKCLCRNDWTIVYEWDWEGMGIDHVGMGMWKAIPDHL